MSHAVLRAIAMVADKRLRAAAADSTGSSSPSDSSCKTPSSPSSECDSLTLLESQVARIPNVSGAGYLCVDLDVYVTHEPCTMCSMALLHSRFRRCVFGQRMPRTGALTADQRDGSGLGLGLFWRPAELNWKMLAWEWLPEQHRDELEAICENGQDSGQVGMGTDERVKRPNDEATEETHREALHA